ncbi:MAG: c-type cytochrome, partial [Methylocella sp.]
MIVPRKAMVAAIAALAVFSAATALYMFALPGLSSARRQPPGMEVAVATWLLRHSVPAAARRQRNPLGADAADAAAGRDLFRQNCEICHGYDGSGRTRIGGGEYPRPPVLRSLIASMTDGEIFYHIRNGIRNTGMPAWTLPDREVWQLVLYARNLPKTATMSADAVAPPPSGLAAGWRYAGSESCKPCHAGIYDRWKKTPMANVVRDPRKHPNAIIPDLSKANPLVHFSKDDIAFV